MRKQCIRLRQYQVVFFLSLMLFLTCRAGAFSAEGDPLYFVQITDTHWGDHDHLAQTKKIVEQINQLPFDIQFVVHTGDIKMDRIEDISIVRKGLSILKELNVPVHFVPGNHDILEGKLNHTRSAYEKGFGSLLYTKAYRGVVFIYVYTEPLARSFTLAGYNPLAQLEKALMHNQGKPVIVFHHTPSVGDFYNNRMHDGWSSPTKEKWVEMLNAYDVKAVIAGHFHRDEHHWLGKVPLYICPPVAGYWGRQATFRIYAYKSGKISYRTQYLP